MNDMTKTVKRPRDVPRTLNTRGRTYKRKDVCTSKKELKQEAKKFKKANPNSHYLIRAYKNVKVRSNPLGKMKRKTLYALFLST